MSPNKIHLVNFQFIPNVLGKALTLYSRVLVKSCIYILKSQMSNNRPHYHELKNELEILQQGKAWINLDEAPR